MKLNIKILFVLLLITIISGCTQQTTTIPTDKLYSSSIDILPNIQDMPSGSGARLKDEVLNETHSERLFILSGLYYVHYKVTKYSTIEDAKSNYINVTNKIKKVVKVDNIEFGDEAIMYEELFTKTIFIRKNNIVITIVSDNFWDILSYKEVLKI
jgi:hypothetical protein